MIIMQNIETIALIKSHKNERWKSVNKALRRTELDSSHHDFKLELFMNVIYTIYRIL